MSDENTTAQASADAEELTDRITKAVPVVRSFLESVLGMLGVDVEVRPVHRYEYRATYGDVGTEHEVVTVFIGRVDPEALAPDPPRANAQCQEAAPEARAAVAANVWQLGNEQVNEVRCGDAPVKPWVVDNVVQAYIEVLDRPVDRAGLVTYACSSSIWGTVASPWMSRKPTATSPTIL